MTTMQSVTQAVKPSTSTVASAGLGVPAGIVAVWILETYVTGPIPEDTVKMAIASIVAIVVGMFFSGGTSETSV